MNYYRYHRRRNLKNRTKNFSVIGWLIVINIIVFIIELILLAFSPDSFKYLALNPTSILQGKYLWTIFTHMFVHAPGSFFAPFSEHLLINMFVLFSLGGLCEKIIGKKRFIWFYLVSGIFAGLLSVALSGLFGSADASAWGTRIFGNPAIFMVGASGAIFAIAGLYVTLLPKLKFMIIFLPFFSLPAYIMVPLALFGMWIVSVFANWPVGNVAHFGGFIVGISYGLYLRQRYRRKVKKLQTMFK